MLRLYWKPSRDVMCVSPNGVSAKIRERTYFWPYVLPCNRLCYHTYTYPRHWASMEACHVGLLFKYCPALTKGRLDECTHPTVAPSPRLTTVYCHTNGTFGRKSRSQRPKEECDQSEKVSQGDKWSPTGV